MIDKLYAAGLASLEVMFAARADDIAQTTGIPLALAERIVEKVQTYRKELTNVVPDAGRSAERTRRDCDISVSPFLADSSESLAVCL